MREKITERYDALDGLRTIAALCIVAMHVAFNLDYEIPALRQTNVLYFFDNFTYLFMIISGFGMCCGYYERVSRGEITPSEFYRKRYEKVLPFFACLVLLDLFLNFSVNSLIEGIADITLVFSLLPNPDISVIGVGWTLGVIFLFYLLFPFFCFLLDNRKRAWIAFVVAVFYNVASEVYFLDTNHVIEGFRNRTNFAYCAMFFVSGGILYLYRDIISKKVDKYRLFVMTAAWAATLSYIFRPDGCSIILRNLWQLLIFVIWVCYAIGTNGKILCNACTKFISGISFEIYLCHMIVFRLVEKLGLHYMFGKRWIAYLFTVSIVIIGAMIFSILARRGLKLLTNVIFRISNEMKVKSGKRGAE